MEVSALYLLTVVFLVVFIGGVNLVGGALVGQGLDMTYASDFVVFWVTWFVVIIAGFALVLLVVVTFKEVALEILDIERAILARADEEIEL